MEASGRGRDNLFPTTTEASARFLASASERWQLRGLKLAWLQDRFGRRATSRSSIVSVPTGKKRADSFKLLRPSRPRDPSLAAAPTRGVLLERVVRRTLNGIGLAPVNARGSSARWDFSFGTHDVHLCLSSFPRAIRAR